VLSSRIHNSYSFHKSFIVMKALTEPCVRFFLTGLFSDAFTYLVTECISSDKLLVSAVDTIADTAGTFPRSCFSSDFVG